MSDDPLAGALDRTEALRALYDDPMPLALRKDIGVLDDMCRRLIAASPMLFLATAGADGRCDVSPRGGPPGFVAVLDDRHLAIPDATGNRRLDSLENIVATGRAALIFLIPGRDTTLRVNGTARVSARADLLERLTPVGKAPRAAIVVRAEEVYGHCAKAFVRSALWDPATWPDPAGLPTPAEVNVAHRREAGLTVEGEERRLRDSLLHQLD